MNCPTCNAPNAEGSRFCVYCGAEMVASAAAVPPAGAPRPPPLPPSGASRPASAPSAAGTPPRWNEPAAVVDDDLEDSESEGRFLRPHRGSTVLVFGILGFFVCFGFGIAAWVMGNADLEEMRKGRMDRSGESSTSAGRICGIISTVLNLVGIVIFVIVALTSAKHGHRSY